MFTEPNQQLPVQVTSVTVQKKNKQRYSLYTYEGFLIGVSEETLLDLNLAKGTTVTHALFKKIQQKENRFAVKSYLLKLLARRDHARRELLDKALRKDYSREVIQDILDELEQKGYLNEEAFTEKFIADKFNLNQWGPAKIRAHLFKKGVSKNIISKKLDTFFEGKELDDTYLNLVLKRKRRFLKEEDLYKRKKKIFDYLHRKGFEPDSIFSHMDKLMKAVSQ